MDFAGILAFSSKKRRMISSNNERRPSGYSLDGFFRRSKITWGHKILSFKQCGVVDAPHCFEAS